MQPKSSQIELEMHSAEAGVAITSTTKMSARMTVRTQIKTYSAVLNIGGFLLVKLADTVGALPFPAVVAPALIAVGGSTTLHLECVTGEVPFAYGAFLGIHDRLLISCEVCSRGRIMLLIVREVNSLLHIVVSSCPGP